MPISINPHLLDGRKWFIARPEFRTSGQEDLWYCAGFFIQWNRSTCQWNAWTQKEPARCVGQTAVGALLAAGWQEPIERILDATRPLADR